MDFIEIYHFLFETYAGNGIMIGAGIVLSLLICVILEFRTRKVYHNHEVDPDEDVWSIFDDEDEDEDKAQAKGKEEHK